MQHPRYGIFECQFTPNDCFPTSVLNVLTNSALDLKVTSIFGLKRKAINALCQYDANSGVVKEISFIADRIQKHLEHRFSGLPLKVRFNQDKVMTLDELKNICTDKDTSYPLVSLAPDYYDDDIVPYTVGGEERPGHTVVVLEIDKRNVILQDPRVCFRSKEPDLRKTILKIPQPRFVRYWDGFAFPYEALWLKRVTPHSLDNYEELYPEASIDIQKSQNGKEEE